MDRVVIFDTTLRDGEQSPGINLNVKEKLEVAEQLARLNVDVIEAGFPQTSAGDFESVRAIADTVKGPTVAALARCVDADIDRAGEALAGARHKRIHVFLSTSDIHRKYMLNATEDEIVEQAVGGVKRAKRFTDDVEFSPQDATRTDFEFLVDICAAAVEAGATHVQGCMNGYGERCGNANLCSVLPNLELKLSRCAIGRDRIANLTSVARFVAELANLPLQQILMLLKVTAEIAMRENADQPRPARAHVREQRRPEADRDRAGEVRRNGYEERRVQVARSSVRWRAFPPRTKHAIIGPWVTAGDRDGGEPHFRNIRLQHLIVEITQIKSNLRNLRLKISFKI